MCYENMNLNGAEIDFRRCRDSLLKHAEAVKHDWEKKPMSWEYVNEQKELPLRSQKLPADPMATPCIWSQAIRAKLNQSPGETVGPSSHAVAGASDGATLSLESPALAQLQEAAVPEAPGPGASGGGDPADDDTWLQSRLQKTRHESAKLQAELSAEKPLQKTREALPAHSQREAIQKAVGESQVVVIEGDTGCGTFGWYIFEDWLKKGQAGAASIIMTQPRRISAIGVADRIANEMNTGLGDLVGYSIRLEAKRSARTRILVCTTGAQGIWACGSFRKLGDYFPGSQSISIPGRTFPVTSYYLEHALMHTNFVIEPDSEYCRKDTTCCPPGYSNSEELRQAYEKPENADLVGTKLPRHVLQQLHRVDPEKINFELVAQVVRHIHTQVDPCKNGKAPGAILVFVPGLSDACPIGSGHVRD
eukprot:s6220_g2.t1